VNLGAAGDKVEAQPGDSDEQVEAAVVRGRAAVARCQPMWLRFARKTTTAAAESGSVVLEGKVVLADKALSIPGSQSRPVFYDMILESFRAPDGRGRAGWNVDRVDVQIASFILEDEAGRIWISVDRDQVVVKGGWNERGMAGRGGRARYSARLIAPGDIVRVRGEVFEPRRAPVDRGLRAPNEGLLEILFRKRGKPVPAPEAVSDADEKPQSRKKRQAKRRK